MFTNWTDRFWPSCEETIPVGLEDFYEDTITVVNTELPHRELSGVVQGEPNEYGEITFLSAGNKYRFQPKQRINGEFWVFRVDDSGSFLQQLDGVWRFSMESTTDFPGDSPSFFPSFSSTKTSTDSSTKTSTDSSTKSSEVS
jgi:hypothetical protein